MNPKKALYTLSPGSDVNALAEPVEWRNIWDTSHYAGFSGDKTRESYGAMWSYECPEGYRALGDFQTVS